MNLESIFEPFRMVHWEWNAENYNNDYLNDYNLEIRPFRDNSKKVVGFAAIMKSRLSTGNKTILKYIAQQDIIIPQIGLMKVSPGTISFPSLSTS
jgi:hypothetical protein